MKRTIAAPWTPAAAIASSFCAVVISSGGALSGRTTRGGCGSKVITTAVAPRSLGHAADALEDLPMTAMHAVEVAERQHRMRPAGRARIVREMNDFHSVIEGLRPSDSRTRSRTPRRAPFAWLARALARDVVGL